MQEIALFCSINEGILSKADGNKSSLGWRSNSTKGLSIEKFKSYVIDKGCAWAPGIFADGHRVKLNFIKSNIVALDIDDGLTLQQGVDRWSTKALCIYTSPSHRKDKKGVICDRYRVVFVLPECVASIGEYEAIIAGMMQKVPEADKACKDASRFFYGQTPGDPLNQYFCFGNVLTAKTIELLKSLGELKKENLPLNKPPAAYNPITELDKYRCCQAVFNLPDHIPNEDWIRLVGGIISKFGVEFASDLIGERWPENTRDVATIPYDQLTYGSAVFVYNKYRGD